MLVRSSKKKAPVVVQSFRCVWLFANWRTPALQAFLSFTISQSLLKVMSIESVMPSNHNILCSHLLFLPSIFPSIRIFSNEWAHHIRLPKYWSFNFNISATKEYSGLISFRTDYLDLLVVQETLKSLLQHQFESIISSVLSLLYYPTLTSEHDYWENHSLDYRNLCWQSDVSTF